MRFVKKLDKAEVTILEEAVKNSTNHKFRVRCQCILFSNKGVKVKKLAKMFDVRTRTIYTWMDRYKQMGFIGLFFLSYKKKSILSLDTKEHIEVVEEVLKTDGRNLKKAVVKIGEKLGLNISNSQLKRFIKKMGYTWKRFRKSLKIKQDPIVYKAKLKELKELYILEEKGMLDIYYCDESGFNLTPYVPYGWQPKGKYIELLPKKSKRLNVLGFMNKKNDLIPFITEQSINSDFVIACVDNFADTLCRRAVIIMDNASIHHSGDFEDKIEEWKEKGIKFRIKYNKLNI